jgi:hypothetical protein
MLAPREVALILKPSVTERAEEYCLVELGRTWLVRINADSKIEDPVLLDEGG